MLVIIPSSFISIDLTLPYFHIEGTEHTDSLLESGVTMEGCPFLSEYLYWFVHYSTWNSVLNKNIKICSNKACQKHWKKFVQYSFNGSWYIKVKDCVPQLSSIGSRTRVIFTVPITNIKGCKTTRLPKMFFQGVEPQRLVIDTMNFIPKESPSKTGSSGIF